MRESPPCWAYMLNTHVVLTAVCAVPGIQLHSGPQSGSGQPKFLFFFFSCVCLCVFFWEPAADAPASQDVMRANGGDLCLSPSSCFPLAPSLSLSSPLQLFPSRRPPPFRADSSYLFVLVWHRPSPASMHAPPNPLPPPTNTTMGYILQPRDTVFFFLPFPPAEPKLAARNPSPFCPHLLVFPSHDLSYIQDFSPAMLVHVRRCGYIKHAISPTAVATLAVCAAACFIGFWVWRMFFSGQVTLNTKPFFLIHNM